MYITRSTAQHSDSEGALVSTDSPPTSLPSPLHQKFNPLPMMHGAPFIGPYRASHMHSSPKLVRKQSKTEPRDVVLETGEYQHPARCQCSGVFFVSLCTIPSAETWLRTQPAVVSRTRPRGVVRDHRNVISGCDGPKFETSIESVGRARCMRSTLSIFGA